MWVRVRVCVLVCTEGGTADTGARGDADAVEIGAESRSELEEREHVAHRWQQRGASDVRRVSRESSAQKGFQVLCFSWRLGRRWCCTTDVERSDDSALPYDN